jgi:hypothetical protein
MELARFQLVSLDCPDPVSLANFYSQLTGLAVEPLGDFAPENVTWIELLHEGKPTISFQRVQNFVAPTWPEGSVPQQLHIDFTVLDLDEAEQHVMSIGGSKCERKFPGLSRPGRPSVLSRSTQSLGQRPRAVGNGAWVVTSTGVA